VDPEVLKQLGEEQKQILFIKMREEQLRKWRLWETEMDSQENGKTMEHPKFMKNGSHRVQ
jgi:SH2 domain-containing protein 4A